MLRKLFLAALVVTPAALLAAEPPMDRGAIKAWDTNGDGVLSRDEAQAAADARVAQLFERLDANKDGLITSDETQQARTERQAAARAHMDERFKAADTNGDGLLSKEEAQKGMPMLGRRFDALDTNKDGAIARDELENAGGGMRHRRGPRG
jgi:Ca2+-binding EF-hand superfamily protein